MVQLPHLYRAFGIDFQSALALPEMRIGNAGTATPVRVERTIAAPPDDTVVIADGVRAGPAVFWMDVPGIVRLLVRDGCHIAVQLAEGARESDARAFLLGSALGALLHQRELLPIHASAVEINGRAYAFVGHSGAGKSTLALALTGRGHRLLCDDIVAIDLSGPRPVCWPGLVNVKLWGKTLAASGLSSEGLEQVLPDLDKYRLPVATLADDSVIELGGAFALARVDAHEEPRLSAIGGTEAATLLIANTFRGQLVAPMQRAREHFSQCIAVATQVDMQRLARPWNLARNEKCCALIERSITR